LAVFQRCLIVDDSPVFLASASTLLDSQGVKVSACASNSEAALVAAEKSRVDIALVDVELGDEDGLGLARALVERDPNLRVVLISAYEFDDVSELIEGSGAVGFISKTALSRQAINQLLGR